MADLTVRHRPIRLSAMPRSRCPPSAEIRNWRYRKNAIVNLTLSEAPDILGLQEMTNLHEECTGEGDARVCDGGQAAADNDPLILADLEQYPYIDPPAHLSRDFLREELACSGVSTRYARDECYDGALAYGAAYMGGGSPKAIFYKKSRFKRADVEPNLGQITYTARMPEDGNRTATWAVLEDVVEDPQQYFVINTHLTHASTEERARVRAEQILELRAAIVENNVNDLPVVILGDMNARDDRVSGADAWDPAYGYEGLSFRDRLTVGIVANGDVGTYFDGYSPLDDGSDVTTNHQLFGALGGGKIDYILHDDRLTTLGVSQRILGNYSFVPGYSVEHFLDWWRGRIPSWSSCRDAMYPSDHMPVMATLGRSYFGFPSAFDWPLAPVSWFEGTGGLRVYFADVTGDGCADKILWNPTVEDGKYTNVAQGNCDGTFGAPDRHNGGSSGVEQTRMYFADVNGDGRSDKLWWRYNYNDGKVKIYLAQDDWPASDDQPFDGSPRIDEGNPDAQVLADARTQLWFPDVDGDGCADMVYWNYALSSRTRVRLTACPAPADREPDESYGFGSPIEHSGGSSGVSSTRMFFADLNGDGAADKVWYRWGYSEQPSNTPGDPCGARPGCTNCIKIYWANGDGAFDGCPAYDLTGTDVMASSTELSFADVNGDAEADKIVWAPDVNLGKALIYLANDQGFDDRPIQDNVDRDIDGAEWSNAVLPRFPDVDGDGRADKLIVQIRAMYSSSYSWAFLSTANDYWD
ncbi:MAG: endonuclease/exonuclease/phosphatase family protein, partial [Verrucomicrobia bacterium]|nr:endonuclease/exonuclease/phosphatase family protein [Verrucomicrobiota bacterium]